MWCKYAWVVVDDKGDLLVSTFRKTRAEVITGWTGWTGSDAQGRKDRRYYWKQARNQGYKCMRVRVTDANVRLSGRR